MPLKIANRVKESSLTTGYDTLVLRGALAGYQGFGSVLTDGDFTYYTIVNQDQWEVGVGTYSSNTLSRDTILSSSNSDSKINLSGQSFVFIAYPSEKSVYQDTNGQVVVGDAGIILDSGTPPATTNTLYNINGGLYFNGIQVALNGPANQVVYYDSSTNPASDSNFTWNSGTSTLSINGHIAATTKSFLIDHPLKNGCKLQYACLEGPENGVYYRGTLNCNRIDLPEHWNKLVDTHSITVHLTPGKFYLIQPYVVNVSNKLIMLSKKFCGSYLICGERKDVPKLEVEKWG